MDFENKENYIYVIGSNDDFANMLCDLHITDVFDVRDRTQKRLVMSKLAINNSKLLIESNFLKVISIDTGKNKVILELDSESDRVFKMLDNRIIELFGELLSDDSNDKMNHVELNMEGELTYVPLISDDTKLSNTLRLCLDTKTTLKYNKNTISIDNVKVGDMFRFLIEIESINLYPGELLCHIRPYCHMGEIYRTNTYKLNKRVPINNYIFSTDVEKVFQTVVLDDQDINLIKTEVEPDIYIETETKTETETLVKHENNIQTTLDNFSEKSEKNEEIEKNEEKAHLTINNTNDNVSEVSKPSDVNENLSIPVKQMKPTRKYTKKNDLNKGVNPTNTRKKKVI
jgi:hypothetical protein